MIYSFENIFFQRLYNIFLVCNTISSEEMVRRHASLQTARAHRWRKEGANPNWDSPGRCEGCSGQKKFYTVLNWRNKKLSILTSDLIPRKIGMLQRPAMGDSLLGMVCQRTLSSGEVIFRFVLPSLYTPYFRMN